MLITQKEELRSIKVQLGFGVNLVSVLLKSNLVLAVVLAVLANLVLANLVLAWFRFFLASASPSVISNDNDQTHQAATLGKG